MKIKELKIGDTLTLCDKNEYSCEEGKVTEVTDKHITIKCEQLWVTFPNGGHHTKITTYKVPLNSLKPKNIQLKIHTKNEELSQYVVNVVKE